MSETDHSDDEDAEKVEEEDSIEDTVDSSSGLRVERKLYQRRFFQREWTSDSRSS